MFYKIGTINKIAFRENIDTKSAVWANTNIALGKRLREIKSNLELSGIKIDINENSRTITFSK